MKTRILVTGLVFGVALLAAESGGELYQKAVTAERAGKMEDAIKLYEKVAHDFASDRPPAAKALVAAARGYEKLGQDKATKLYEEVTREYADQREFADTARTRLAALRQQSSPPAMTQRRIDLPYPGQPTYPFLSTDGHREIYVDAASGALTIGSLAGTEKRAIFKPKPGEQVAFALPSRDFSIVAMSLARPNGPAIAFVRTDGTGYREIDKILGGLSWSWDNRYLFATDFQKSPPEIVRISAADGEIRTVRAFDGVYPVLSPDGRFFAVADAEAFQRLGKISIVPIQGGEPQLVADNARLLDWTRDGRYLIIASDRSGPEALYLVPIRDGRLAGDPIFVRYGSFTQGLTAADGALVYQSTPAGGGWAAFLGALDFQGPSVEWKRLSLSGSSHVAFEPRWSPDSTQIVYGSNDEAIGRNTFVIRVRNMASGEERELYRGSHTACIWAAQRPTVFCGKGQLTPPMGAETFSIATDSGRVESLPFVRLDNGGIFFSSHDDRWIYGWRLMIGPDSIPELIRLDPTTMQATVVDRIPGPFTGGNWLGLDPDEHWAARRVNRTTEIRPMSADGVPAGDWKSLLSVGDTQMSLTPDGKWVLYHDVDSAGKQGLFRISTSGGQPERIGDFPADTRTGHLRISPDGKRVIAESPVASPEVWVLENFEPKPAGAPVAKGKQ